MISGYLFALLGLASFGVLGLLSKFSETMKCRPGPTSTFMYAWPTVLVSIFVVFFRHSGFRVPLPVAWVAIPFGASGAIATLALLAALKYGKISTSWLILNLSALEPAVLSVVIYRERIGPRKEIAILLAMLALVFVYTDKQLEPRPSAGFGDSGRGKASAP